MAAFQHEADRSGLPIVVVGDSAGGNLACSVCHARRGSAHAPIGQVLIYSGLGSDLTQGSFVEHAEAPMLTTRDTMFYKTIRTGGDASVLRDKRCTPLNDVDFSNLPPVVAVSADCDPLRDNSPDYVERVRAAGGKAHWINEAGLVHGYLRARHSVGRARESFARICDAIASLGKSAWPY